MITERYHGPKDAERAREGFKALFKDKLLPQDIESARVASTDEKMWLPRVLVEAGLAQGTSAAVRLMEQGGVRVDGERVTDKKAELKTDGEYLIQVGKRAFKRVSFERG